MLVTRPELDGTHVDVCARGFVRLQAQMGLLQGR